MRSKRSDAKVEVRFLHADSQGSLYAVTDKNGWVEYRYEYDAWGKQYKTFKAGWALQEQQRGYTDHVPRRQPTLERSEDNDEGLRADPHDAARQSGDGETPACGGERSRGFSGRRREQRPGRKRA